MVWNEWTKMEDDRYRKLITSNEKVADKESCATTRGRDLVGAITGRADQ